MKKIGKNTKLYLIGMIIGGITLGITTVIADTIINSTSVAYKTTTVKAALDELYGLADLKPKVEELWGMYLGDGESGIKLGLHGSGRSFVDFRYDGAVGGYVGAFDDNSLSLRAVDSDTDQNKKLRLEGTPITFNDTAFEDMFVTREFTGTAVSIEPLGNATENINIGYSGYTPLQQHCIVSNCSGEGCWGMSMGQIYGDLITGSTLTLGIKNFSETNTIKVNPVCWVLYVKNTATWQ